MKVLVDTNVLLDVALQRPAFFSNSDRVLRWCENHGGHGFIAWHTVSNLYYILRKSLGDGAARGFISTTLTIVEVARVGTPEAKHALHLSLFDYEDALQVTAAVAAGVDVIVTRDEADFAGAIVRAQSPEAFLASLPS